MTKKTSVDLFMEAVVENQVDLKKIPKPPKYENVKEGPFREMTNGGIWHPPSIFFDIEDRKRLGDAEPGVRNFCIRFLYKQAAESCIEEFEKMMKNESQKN